MQIHELNDYSGGLTGNAYMAIDNGTDTGKVPFTDLFPIDGAVELFSGNLKNKGDTATLEASISNYDFLDVYYIAGGFHSVRVPKSRYSGATSGTSTTETSGLSFTPGESATKAYTLTNSPTAGTQIKISRIVLGSGNTSGPTFTAGTSGSASLANIGLTIAYDGDKTISVTSSGTTTYTPTVVAEVTYTYGGESGGEVVLEGTQYSSSGSMTGLSSTLRLEGKTAAITGTTTFSWNGESNSSATVTNDATSGQMVSVVNVVAIYGVTTGDASDILAAAGNSF